MGRQRTVNDQGFWHSPLLQSCTTEDKTALLHLLTSPVSNVIGAYTLVPRIAAAEVGWSQDQWLQVVERLRAEDLVWFEPVRMFVWVRIWWFHNLASQTLGPKLRARTIENIRQLPEPWVAPFLSDYRARLTEELRQLLDKLLAGHVTAETSSVPYGYGIDDPSNLSLHNTNANDKTNSKLTPTPDAPAEVSVDKSGIPASSLGQVEAAIAKAQRKGVSKAGTQAILSAVAKQYQSNRPPRDAGAYAYAVAQSLVTPPQQPALPAPPSKSELKAWAGRCFCWPAENPSSFMRVEEAGFCEQVTLKDGEPRHGYAPLRRGNLLSALREGKLREVSVVIFEDLAKGVRP